jgi:hypothetical protein
MTSASVEQDGSRPRPPVGGALLYLVTNFPLGIAGFVTLVTMFSVGLGTAVIWVGLPVLALAVLIARGAARMERARVRALLGTFIAQPYPPLPDAGQKDRWKARLRDGSTWRDVAYFVLLLPVGVAEFTLMVAFWSASLALAGLPIYYRFLPGGAYFFPSDKMHWIVVDSTVEALPWAALGVLIGALSVALTRSIATGHARYARALLGPSRRVRRMAGTESPVRDPAVMNAVAGW